MTANLAADDVVRCDFVNKFVTNIVWCAISVSHLPDLVRSCERESSAC